MVLLSLDAFNTVIVPVLSGSATCHAKWYVLDVAEGGTQEEVEEVVVEGVGAVADEEVEGFEKEADSELWLLVRIHRIHIPSYQMNMKSMLKQFLYSYSSSV